MARVKAEYFNAKDKVTGEIKEIQFIPPAPSDGDLGGISQEKLEQIDELKSDLANSKKAIEELNDKKITKFYANNLGETTLQDSDNGKIVDMFLYGKSLQNGTPTPDNPIEIKSVVNPVVKVFGKNLLKSTLETTTMNGITCTNNGDGTYIVNGTATAQTSFALISNTVNDFNGEKILGCPSGGSELTYSILASYYDENNNWLNEYYDTGNGFVITDIPKIGFGILIRDGVTCNNLVFKPMITTDLNATYDDFEPYKEQSATLPYTLNAIPVSSGGNVAIDGQQYIADYVDIENKKLVRMVDESKLDTTVSIIDNTDLLLETPTINDLTDEEVQAFKELTTYYPTTNVMVTSDQLDGYAKFNYPLSMANGWNLIKEQLGDTREYIYDMELQSAEAYVNSEYAVTLTELGV